MTSDNLKNIKHVINGDYIVIPIETGYIKPNDNLDAIINPALNKQPMVNKVFDSLDNLLFI